MDKLDRYTGLLSMAGFPPKDDGAFKNNWDHVAPAIVDHRDRTKTSALRSIWGLHYDAGVDFFAFYLFLAQTHISHQSLSFQIDTWTRIRVRRVVFPLTRDLTKLLTGKQPRRRWLLIIRPCYGPAN